MNRKNIFLISCLSMLLMLSARSQSPNTSYKLHQISSEKGLSQYDVDCIIQDKLGFIWIATYDGLNKYDGNKFTIFRHVPGESNSISSNRIKCLQEWPERNELWIGTDGGGLNRYKLKEEKFTTYLQKHTEGERIITALHYHDNTLWVGSISGLTKITYNGNDSIQIIPVEISDHKLKGVKELFVTSITHDNQNNIIVSTRNGLYVKSPNESSFSLAKDDIGILQVVPDKNGNIWTVSTNELCFYPVLLQQMKNYLSLPNIISLKGTNHTSLKTITPITENLLLAATETNQVFWIHNQNNTISFEDIYFTNTSFFENNFLKTIFLDNTMNVWIGSSMDGVARFDLNEKQIYHYPLLSGKKGKKNFIQAIAKDKHGRLWIGATEGCFITNIATHKTCKINHIDKFALDIIKDNDNNIWCTSFNNLSLFPEGNEHNMISLFDREEMPSSASRFDGPYGLCEDKKNGIIWVGLRSGLLQIRYKHKKLNIKHIEKDKFNNPYVSNIMKLYLDSTNNSLLIGTASDGTYIASLNNQGDITAFTPMHSNTNDNEDNHIWAIHKATNGIIYEGTDSGIKTLIVDSTGAYHEYELSNPDPRLRSYKVVSIIEDDKKNLWISTGMGLLCYNLTSGEIKEYLDTDGLSSRILTEGALYDENNNRLYIGSIKGLNIIDLSSLWINEIAPKTIIHSMKINNQSIHPGIPYKGRIILSETLAYAPSIRLKHNENNFSIDFTALHFSNPQKNRYAYKMEGLNEEWVDNAHSNTVTFTNMPHGRYTLLVKSANPDGIWEKEPTRLSITITPAPWNTVVAYLLYALVFLSVLYFIYRYIFNKKEFKHRLFMEQLENQKKIEIAEVKLKYHTNITHELRTPLSLIVAPVEELISKYYDDKFLQSRLQSIKQNTNRLLELVEQVLDFRKIVTDNYSLHIKNYNIKEKLKTIKKGFVNYALQKNIGLELFYDTAIENCWCDIEIVNKICYNLLSNAVKYTDNGGKIIIYVSTDTNQSHLRISVEDNGIGIDEKEIDKIFERFYQVSDISGGTGIGLHLCRHLANIHQGSIEVKSVKGEGSIFTFELPINRDAYPSECIFETRETCDSPKEEKTEEEKATDDIENTKKEAKPLILVVEDNSELRQYIVSLLTDHAKVIQAENGETGYNLASSNIPDIIISDIMMPVMDGIELTQKCKEDTLTSHIPIILLTAKDTIEDEIDGLRYGADDYIRKPFNPQALQLKINNLIKLTRKKKEESDGLQHLNERELAFLNQFEKIVLDNISSPEFGIEDICRLMFVSRMQLYRKTIAIINKKPSQYIKEIKMKKAMELITQKGCNITEAMYDTGYTNYTHFSKLFAEVNGVSPRKLLGMKE